MEVPLTWPRLLLVLLLSCHQVAAAPANPAALQGLDEFLAAFEGFAIPEEQQPADAQPVPEESDIGKGEAHCLGCVREITEDSLRLRSVAQTAAALLEDQLTANHTNAVTQVYRAAEQVVNGILYFLTLELAPTNCTRPVQEEAVCSVDTETASELYAVELLDQPHLNNTALLLAQEVNRTEVEGLPGLFAGPEPPTLPTEPTVVIGVSADGDVGADSDLAALLDQLEDVTILPAANEATGPTAATGS
ncbi:uncharacterized protein LOC119093293 [Pollicipes pollicipes]|uniref:uncharacterized protein LOC119093293 n=1 Tax=Pollicipes pollicipes TaxID=41117 RepID=UPI0018851DE9|nr:uncharacterized protein LOC119093293 [Pollicipes pollicipes]XP_037072124.1 uncharacterized protein LOC119093293 [Pollicipes pollicipes]